MINLAVENQRSVSVVLFVLSFYADRIQWPHLVESIMLQPGICPSVCPISILTVTQQGAACNAASVHYGLTIRRTVILVI